MCNCKKTEGFNEKLAQAKALTTQTGDTHVVYVHKAVNMVFMRKESDLNDALGICCYFLPDGTEVDYIPKGVSDIEVNEPETVTPKESKNAETVMDIQS